MMAAPVKNTCPDIDKCIKAIRSAIKTAEYGMKNADRNSDEYDNYKSILWEIENIEGSLEDLRSANDALRSWGKELEEEQENAANYINELEEKIQDFESKQNFPAALASYDHEAGAVIIDKA